MPNYNNSKIYRIVCNITGENYYGSTTETLAQRMGSHRKATKRNKKTTANQIIDRGNYDIILVEEYPCDNKEQLHKRERYYIEKNKCINHNIPSRTIKEYYQANKEKRLQQFEKYRQDNQEQIKEQRTKKVVCECGSIISRSNLKIHHNSQKHINFLKNEISTN